jgi:3-deoxy-7-phosphoheptulonate synthase|mmetsp:Transcript_451/g.1300  ORF Transcript_451/g.1300 Transcript_451/m.1300 type:complete len:497 (-) Transcript_451:49-1539(-)
MARALALLGLCSFSSALVAPVATVRKHDVARPVLQTPVDAPWSPGSWRDYEAKQIPVYDADALREAEEELAASAPLVFAGEVRTLMSELGRACKGDGFVIFGGDCAESFDEFSVDHVRDTFRVILQMALVCTYGGGQPVIKIGRMAGQFAKPRSSPTETIDGVELPSYQGDNINKEAPFTADARKADPRRMVQAYHQCSQTLNILRAFSTGGYADLSRLHNWNLDFVEQTVPGSQYRRIATKVEESLRFMRAIGVDTTGPEFTQTTFYTAHECLLLPYEQAMTREDSTTGRWYDCSAHLLWVGERTRQPGMAHFEFVRGIQNPVGVKISDKASPADVLEILDTFNPKNVPGKVTLITRMSADKLRTHLPPILEAVQREGRAALWVCDPVHGNTYTSSNGYKTRDFDAIRAEIEAFFDVHEQCGTHAGGIHLEMTGKDVTECVGGGVNAVTVDGDRGLASKYLTHCDPRLNSAQALELGFLIAERLRGQAGLPSMLL